jgi:hypothetical protein
MLRAERLKLSATISSSPLLIKQSLLSVAIRTNFHCTAVSQGNSGSGKKKLRAKKPGIFDKQSDAKSCVLSFSGGTDDDDDK